MADWQVTRCGGKMRWFLHRVWRAAPLLICMAFLAGLCIKFNVDTSSFSKPYDHIWFRIREMNHRQRAPATAPVVVVTRNHNITGGCIGLSCAPPASLASRKGDGLTDASITSRFRARVDRVREACEAYRGPEISPEIQFEFLYFSEKYNLMVCASPKVGTTTWISYMLLMRGVQPPDKYVHTEQIRRLVRARNVLGMQGTVRRLPRATTIMAVRHPLERLVSAFRDKFFGGGLLYESLDKDKYWYLWRSALILLQKNPDKPQNITFVDFVQFVKHYRWDDHWEPLHLPCQPCSIHYEYVVRLETFREDLDFLHRTLPNPVLGRPLHRHATVIETASSPPSEETVTTSLHSLTLEYYRQLPPDLLSFVLDFYSFDMQLFGYRVPEELACRAAQAKHSEEKRQPIQSRRAN